MNVNFNGYGEGVVTFMADDSLTKTGTAVAMSADGTVADCSNGVFCGVCVGLRNGFAAVKLSGYVNMPSEGSIGVGYKKLIMTNGKITESNSGREYLVVDCADGCVGFIL